MAFDTATLTKARESGYSDEEVGTFLSQSDPRVQTAIQSGYSLDEIASHFDPKEPEVTEPPKRPLAELSSRVLASAAEGGLQAATMLGRISPMAKLGDFIHENTGLGMSSKDVITELEGAAGRAKDEYGVDPKFDKGLLSATASGLGSLGPIVASGPLAPITGGLMGAEQKFQESTEAGVTGGKRVAASALGGATAAVTEYFLGLPKAIKIFKGASQVPLNTMRQKVISVLSSAGKTAGLESLQEGTEQILNDLIAKGFYDPERKVFDAGKIGTAMAAGALVGGAFGGVTQTAFNAQSVAPKEQMQDVAQSVDESLVQIASEQPPVTGVLPTVNKTPQETPIISPEEMQAVPEGTMEELQTAVTEPTQPATESTGPRIVSTGIQTSEGLATGDGWNTKHADIIRKSDVIKMALAEGMTIEELDAQKGFIVEEDGKQRFVGRKEALEIARKSGQVDESVLYDAEKQGLISEALIEPQNAVQEPKTTEVLRDVPQQREVSEEVPAPKSPERIPPSPQEAAVELQQYREQAIQAAKAAGATDPEAAASDAQREMAEKGITDPKQFIGTARNRGIDQQRAAKKTVPQEAAPEPTTQTGPRAEAVARETASSIEEVISTMPETDQKVMRAYMESGGTDQEVARDTNLTLDQVKKAKSRARQTLAQFVRSQGIGSRMAPGASNVRELQNARFTLASDIYEGLRQTGELSRSTWEKNVLREYGDIFDQQQLDEAWAVSQEVSSQFQEGKGRKPIPKIIDQLTGAKPGEGVTSIKNAQADIERRTRGLPAAMKAARRAQVGLWDETIRHMEENPQAQRELISRLNQDTRLTVNDRDLMMLTHAKLEAENRYEEALKAVNEATTEQSQLEAMQMAREAEANLINIYDIAKQVGSEQGRAFAARKMMISRDFSVAQLASQVRAAQGGKELTQDQTEKIQEISTGIQETEAQLDARTSELEQEQSQKAFNETVKDFQERLPFDQRILAIANKIVAKLDAAAQKARQRILKRLQNTNALVDPTLIYDLAVVGAAKIAHGLRDLAWKNSMRSEFGEEINPHLDQVYQEANQMIDRLEEEVPEGVRTNVRTVVRKEGSKDVLKDTQEKLKTRSEEGESLHDMRAMVQKMALALVRSGVTDPTKLLDTIHSIVEPMQKGITKREVMDLVSGYGDFKALDMEKAKVTLRDLKGQYQNLAKLEDIQTKQKVEKTGIERRRPSDEERRLIREVNEAKKKMGVGTLEAYKTRLQHSIADLQDRINRKDFRKQTPVPLDVSKDPEAVRLAAENAKWKKKFEIEKLRAQREMETRFEKTTRLGKEVLNIPRAVKSSMDFSAVLRQGGFISFGNPARAAKNLIPMFKSAVSEEQFNRSEAEIRSRPNSDLYKRSKLFLADMDGGLNSREEAFRAELADRIPIIGRFIRGSNRAYISFLNRIRADSFDAIVGSLTTNPTPEQLKAISHYINVSTGRGDLGVHGSAAETLSTVLWSPRLLISRIQLLAAEPLLRKDAAGVRKVIAKEYAKSLTGAAVVLALGLLAGADVEEDPRSSDFGKMKSGDTRIDPWMGLQQITVLGSRLASGETKTMKGEILSLRKTEDKKRPPWAETGFDVSARFLRTKLTPLLGSFFNLASGESVVGDKATLGSEARELVTPLSFGDILPIMEANGIPKGTAMEILNLFGMSVQHYSKEKKSP